MDNDIEISRDEDTTDYESDSDASQSTKFFIHLIRKKHQGVLVTHNAFKFTKNNWSRDGSTYWYRCSAKKATGCPASATVKRVEELEPDGSVVVKNYLLEVSTPEVRYKFGQYI